LRKRPSFAEADRLGLKVTNEEVIDALKRGQLGEVLFPNGQFIGDDKYDALSPTSSDDQPQFEQLVASR